MPVLFPSMSCYFDKIVIPYKILLSDSICWSCSLHTFATSAAASQQQEYWHVIKLKEAMDFLLNFREKFDIYTIAKKRNLNGVPDSSQYRIQQSNNG